MSRSFKKVPGFTQGYGGDRKFWKRISSKKVRNYKGEISNGSNFKRLYDSWNICDWKFLEYTWPNKRKKRTNKDYKYYIK